MRHCASCVLLVLAGLAAAQTSTLPDCGQRPRRLNPAICCATSGNSPLTPTAAASLELLARRRASRISSGRSKPSVSSLAHRQAASADGAVVRHPLARTIAITAERQEFPMSPAADFVLWSICLENADRGPGSELVFAGYGVVAPEYQWDDYAGLDVKGKTVMVITGDPPVADRR